MDSFLNRYDPYINSVCEIVELAMKRALFLPYHSDFIFRLSPAGRRFFNHVKRVHEKAEATIKDRRRELARLAENKEDIQEEGSGKKRRHLDFLDVLLQARVN